MQNYQSLRLTATKLRREGRSYSEILQKVPVSKSSLSLWLRNVSLKPRYRKRLKEKTAAVLKLGHLAMKTKRAKEIDRIRQNAAKEIPNPINSVAYKLLGAALYWAEGSKTKHFAITNSDPTLIQFIIHWINDILEISPKSLRAELNIYPQQNENSIKSFWSRKTGIPLQNFKKSFIKPISSGYKKNILYHGTIRVRVPCGTNHRHRVWGWLQKVLENHNIQVENDTKW